MISLVQSCEYAESLLEQLDGSFRSKILLALTDLKHIMFVEVTRNSRTRMTTYMISPEMDNVLAALCAVLRMSDNEVGSGLNADD